MPSVGPMELIIVAVIALVVFGPKRLPELGRSLGSGMREFKDGVTSKPSEVEAAPPATAQVAASEAARAEPLA